MLRVVFLFFLVCMSSSSFAGKLTENFESYFAVIKSSEVNVRKGPNTRYPIEWVFTKKGEPVEVLAKFEHWFRIRDSSGAEGWVKSVMISNKRRNGIILPKNNSKKAKNLYAKLYQEPNHSARVIANIESSKRVELSQCTKLWCKIKVSNVIGWVDKSDIWGVYSNEEFKQ